MSIEGEKFWLIAEYCAHDFLYTGWHLYLRENKGYQRRNKDGGWGWLRRPQEGRAAALLMSLGCAITGDGTTDSDGIAKFASLYPLKGKTVGGRRRGGCPVVVKDGQLSIVMGAHNGR